MPPRRVDPGIAEPGVGRTASRTRDQGGVRVPSRRAEPGVVRVLDATGASEQSWEEAVADAVRSARAEVREPLGVEVARMWADVAATRVTTYRVAVRIAYRQDLRAPGRVSRD